jgi:hypothetical protein
LKFKRINDFLAKKFRHGTLFALKMSYREGLMDEETKKFQENLQSSMKQEIGAMREMLANMHQEELCLIAHDQKAWTQVMMDRVSLLARLSELRSERLQCAKKLENLQDLAELDCEILSMRDQLASLVEKMNQQQHRIQTLETHKGAPSTQYQEIKPKEEIKKRGAIATYPKEK